MTQTSLPSIRCPDHLPSQAQQGIERIAFDDQLAQLVVTFYWPIQSPQQDYLMNPRSYSLTGGQRLFPKIRSAALYNPLGTAPDLSNRRVLLNLDGLGDFSIYTL